jgi:hypothetical protein
MLDLGAKESDLGPIPPPNPGPKNEVAFYTALMGEPMEIEEPTSEMETSSGYESEGSMTVEELLHMFEKLKI